MRMMLTAALLIAAATPVWASELALKRVMLSSAGVGYFEYEAQVEGEAALGLMAEPSEWSGPPLNARRGAFRRAATVTSSGRS